MAFIYNLTDSWTDAATTWNGIKLAVTNTASSASSDLLNLTVTGATTASFVVDKSGNLALNGTVNKITFTAPATGATLTLADNSTFITSGAYSSTFTFTGATTLTFPTSGTVTALGNTTTGSGAIVLASSPSLITPALGTPSSGNLANCTAYPISALSGAGTGVLTALAVNVGAAGSFVTFNGALGTPSSGNLSNCTGYPSGSLTGLGTGVATALANNVGSAGAFVVQNGVLGTPSSGTLTNATGLPLTTGVTGTLPVANGGTGITSFGTGVATALGQNVTGSGGIVLATSPSLTTPNLGTPSAATLTNATGLPISTGVSGLGSGVATFLATPSSANLASAVTDETGSGPLVFATSPTFTSQVTLGTQGTTRGSLVLANTASTYATTIQSSNSATAAYTLTLPTTAGTNGYFLQTDGLGNLAWAAGGGGGGGGTPGGSTTQVQYNNAGSFGGSAAFTFDGTSIVGIGAASATTGTLKLFNSASANGVSLQSGNNSVAWTMTLPTSAGSSGQVLQTNGSGVTSWVSNDAGLTVGTSTISGGTSGRILYDNAGVLGELATTGTGNVVLATSPTLVTPLLGTPTSGTLTNCTGLPVSTGISGLGTSVATALAVNVGTAGAFVVNGGALGTPSSGTLTNCTGLSLTTGVTGTLPVANGGTGFSSITSGYIPYATGANTLGSSANFTFSGSDLYVVGKLGLGTTTPAQSIHSKVGGNTFIEFENTSASKIAYFGVDGNGPSIQSGASEPITFVTGGSERLRLLGTAATLSIGTSAATNPGKVQLYGSTSGSVTLQTPAVAGSNTLTLPASTGTVATTGFSVAMSIVFGG